MGIYEINWKWELEQRKKSELEHPNCFVTFFEATYNTPHAYV